MNIKRGGLLWLWATLLDIDEARWSRRNIDVCSLFWRCALLTPLKLALLGALVSGAIVVAIDTPWLWPGAAVVSIVLIVVCWLGSLTYFSVHGWARSKGVCPILSIVRGGDDD